MSGTTRRILVVEDEPVINGAVTDRLVAAGYDVVRAWDGPGAVAEFTAREPDLVVLDVMLPGLDGHEVCQATAFFGGHDSLERTTGLTYAQYVHQGFGQLTVATALTLLVVWAATRKAPRATPSDRTWIRVSLGLLCALTLVVVASALYRLHLYEQAYGLTRLRLLVAVFEGWLGVLVLAVIAGAGPLRARWLPRFGLLCGVVLLLGLAAANPDAWVARQNLERYAATQTVDWEYLSDLSADALPAYAELPRPLAECALRPTGEERDDWLAWNLGRSRVDAFLDASGGVWQHRTDCPGQTRSE